MLLNNFVDYKKNFAVSGQKDTNTRNDEEKFPEGTGNQ